MGTPFMSEIRMMAFNFPPKGWAFCNGQFLPINQNQALFSLLGTTYGGNGQTTFALPNLQGRVPIHTGPGFVLGQAAGQEAHTVTQSEMPAHNHAVNASSLPGNTPVPTGSVLSSPLNMTWSPLKDPATTLAPGTISNTGGSQPHQNMQPYAVLSFCIALQGVFPSQN